MTNTKYECKNPRFSSFDNSTINLEYKHPDYGWIPFTASENDCEEHCRAIHKAAISGEYGEIAPYDGEIPPTEEELKEMEARAERNRLLAEFDVIVSNPFRFAEFSDEEKAELAAYRQALLDYPQQDGFPNETDLPTCQLLSK